MVIGISSEISPNEIDSIISVFSKMMEIFLKCLVRLSKKKEKYEDALMFGTCFPVNL